jgi:hypothetical protein
MNTKAKKFLKMVETKEDLIRMVEKIPNKQWYVGNFSNNKEDAFCFLGHIGVDQAYDSEDERPIFFKLKQLLGMNPKSYSRGKIVERIGGINDGDNRLYKQATPKQRILAFLRGTK